MDQARASDPIFEFVGSNLDERNLGRLYRGIDELDPMDHFMEHIAWAIAPADEGAIVDEFLSDLQAQTLVKCSEDSYIVWNVCRDRPFGSLPKARAVNAVVVQR